jgi:hypothetical protein
MSLRHRWPVPLTQCESCGSFDINAAAMFCRACSVIAETCQEVEQFTVKTGGMPIPWRYALRSYVQACADTGRPLANRVRVCSNPRQRELLPMPEAPPLPLELQEPAQ